MHASGRVWHLLFATLLAVVAAISAAPRIAVANDQFVAQCGYYLEQLIVGRAARAGFTVYTGPDAQVRVSVRTPQGAVEQRDRHYDLILWDTDNRFLAFETTLASLSKQPKRIQLGKDASAIATGLTFIRTGAHVPAEQVKVVYVLPYTPGPIKGPSMTRSGISYYNYISGDTNVLELNPRYQPTVAVMRSVLVPSQLSAYARQLTYTQFQQQPKAAAILGGVLTAFNIAKDLYEAHRYAATADEVKYGIAHALLELREEYPQGTTFWADVTEGGENAGYFRDNALVLGAGCLPTTTYARVVDMGPANPQCQIGWYQDFSRMTMTAQGSQMRYRYFRVCLEGNAATGGGTGTRYNECEALGDMNCQGSRR